ncbi:unnamed protein product [Notodromas monacha]|uniref:Uncharacterized protein n=1 Tax=Notodromas monacha TaxID=399045 RepID=A0A7R9BW62_9CRUS|nr:unnamed protein product [Notodromas monacha]CAG0922919.1 unnamed protein product [Notodromas monacha]
MIEGSDHLASFVIPAAVALLVLTSSIILCVCAKRKRKAILSSDLPLDFNGIQTISRKAQTSYDSDQFRHLTTENGFVSANRRLPERPLSLVEPPTAPVEVLPSIPSTSHPSLLPHRDSHVETTSSDPERVRDDDVDRPYAKVKIPTKKVKKKVKDEHPYAKIRDQPAVPESDSDEAGPSEEPRVITPHALVEPHHDPHQATFRAEPEPIPEVPVQPHFSGDSQDSRGYTSISVREPLDRIRAQMATTRQMANHESPYASVIEDSDEMYAAIDSAAGSDTYAQIELPPVAEESYFPPQPPSVRSLRSAVQQQARCRISSPPALDVVDAAAAFAAAGPGAGAAIDDHSPLPERRVLNSPLPPTPTPPVERREDVYAKVTNKTRPTAHKRIKSDILRHSDVNYSEFEVVRERLDVVVVDSGGVGGGGRPRVPSESDVDPNYETIGKPQVVFPSGDVYAQIQVSQKRARLPMSPPPLVMAAATSSSLLLTTAASPEPSETYATLDLRDAESPLDDPNYERLGGDGNLADFGYEKVKDGDEEMDDVGPDTDYESLGYNRVVKPCEPGYEEIRAAEDHDSESGDSSYERVGGATSDVAPTYETVPPPEATELYDDGYERLRPKASDLYAVVDARSKTTTTGAAITATPLTSKLKKPSTTTTTTTTSSEDKVMCRLMDLPPARKVAHVSMTVVTIGEDEISIRNHLREDGSGTRSTMSTSGIFEDVTLQL